MAQVERQLQIEAKPFLSLPLRLARLYRHVLWLRFQNMGFAPPRQLSFFAAQDVLLEKLLLSLNEFGTFSGSLNEQAKQMLAAIRQAEKNGQAIDRMTRRRRRELAFILRNPQEVYHQPRWQQEHIAECLKRQRKGEEKCDSRRFEPLADAEGAGHRYKHEQVHVRPEAAK